jgi:hypothetical protein
MANENVTTQNTDTTVTENKQTTTTPQADNSAPSVEELMAQLATERAEKERNKLALDKALKEKGDITKQLRAKQTAEEQEAEAQKEAQRLADEERESMRKELNHIKAVNAYKSIPDEKVVENLIDAISDADHNTIAQIIENEKKKAVAEAEQKWMKERPRVNHGQYSSMTKEQIMAIADRDEKLKAIAMNRDLFN